MKKFFSFLLILTILLFLTSCEVNIPENGDENKIENCNHLWEFTKEIYDADLSESVLDLYTCSICQERNFKETEKKQSENTCYKVTFSGRTDLLVSGAEEYYKTWDTVKFSVCKVENASIGVTSQGNKVTRETSSDGCENFSCIIKYNSADFEITVYDYGIDGEYFGYKMFNYLSDFKVPQLYDDKSLSVLIYDNLYYHVEGNKSKIIRVEKDIDFWNILLSSDKCKQFKTLIEDFSKKGVLYCLEEDVESNITFHKYYILLDDKLYYMEFYYNSIKNEITNFDIYYLLKEFVYQHSFKKAKFIETSPNSSLHGFGVIVETIDDLNAFKTQFKNEVINNEYFDLLFRKYDEEFFKEHQLAIMRINTEYTISLSSASMGDTSLTFYVKHSNSSVDHTINGMWIIFESDTYNFRKVKNINISFNGEVLENKLIDDVWCMIN